MRISSQYIEFSFLLFLFISKSYFQFPEYGNFFTPWSFTTMHLFLWSLWEYYTSYYCFLCSVLLSSLFSSFFNLLICFNQLIWYCHLPHIVLGYGCMTVFKTWSSHSEFHLFHTMNCGTSQERNCQVFLMLLLEYLMLSHQYAHALKLTSWNLLKSHFQSPDKEENLWMPIFWHPLWEVIRAVWAWFHITKMTSHSEWTASESFTFVS